MRKIRLYQIAVFLALLLAAASLAVTTTAVVLGDIALGDFRGVVLTIAAIFFLYFYAIAIYRGFIGLFPLREGEIEPRSPQEFVYHVYILFYLLLFYPVMRSGIPPAPFMRMFYRALGAKLGDNTYSQGLIHDPTFVEIGANSVVGQSALLVPHVIEGDRLAHYPIRVGDHVTIGAGAAVLAGVVIGNHAVVATGAVIPKGTHIGEREVWGGVPAKLLHKKPAAEVSDSFTSLSARSP